MASDKQIAANRRNSQKSTGPVTEAGKAASSMNALKTGLRAKSLIIPGETADDLQELIAEYYDAYRPATPEARGLLDDLILCEWTLRRLAGTEASLCNYQNSESFHPVAKAHRAGKVAASNSKSLSLLQRRIDATRRGRDRAIQQLRELAAKPLRMPVPLSEPTPIDSITSTEIGFVRPLPSDPPAGPAAPAIPAPAANSGHPEASSTVG